MAASTLRLVDGADELVLSGTGGASPILVVDSEFTSPRGRVVEQDRLGISGKRDFTRLHESSEFAATLKVQGDEYVSRYEYLDELKGFLAFHKRPYLYVQRDGWISERRCLLRGDGVAVVVGKASGHWLDASVRVVLPEGVLEDAEATTIRLRSGSQNLGVSYPLDYPLEYTPNTTSNSYTVDITGTDLSQPYIRIFGDCTDPEIVLTAPDESVHRFTTSGLAVPAGSYIDIDFVNRRVFLDGTVENSYYSKVDFEVSSWWVLEPGVNRLLFNSASPSDSSYAEITYRNNYLP